MKRLLLLASLSCACIANVQADCTLTLSPSSVSYEARTLNALQVSRGADTLSFGERRVQLSVHCPNARPISVHFEAPAASRESYRFGPGVLQLRVVSARLDGEVVEWLREPDGARSASLLRPGDRLRPSHNGQPLQGQQWHVEMILAPSVNRNAVNVADLSQFQALGSFRLE